MQQISDNEIYLLIKYIKSVLWRLAKRLSYIEDARCLKFKFAANILFLFRKSNIMYGFVLGFRHVAIKLDSA